METILKSWYYVIYENSTHKAISSALYSLEEVVKYIDHAKEIDKQGRDSYHYSIVQGIEIKNNIMETFEYIAQSNQTGEKVTNHIIANNILTALKNAQAISPFRTILSIKENVRVTQGTPFTSDDVASGKVSFR